MTVNNFDHNEAVYALAIEKADYRRACWIAIRGARKSVAKVDQLRWQMRLCGAFRLRGLA